jgi:CBS domain-containing protein
MQAAEVMTRKLVSIREDATVRDAIHLMLDNQISGLPVVDGAGHVVGIVTEGDLLRRSETGTERRRPRWLEILMGPGRLSGEYVRTHTRRVGDIMTRDVATVPASAELDQIVETMERRRVKRVPVTEGDRLVGIVSRADLLRALVQRLDQPPAPAAAGDAAIRDRVLAELEAANWAPRVGVTIDVKDGVVLLEGVVSDDKERAALRVAAENVPGVKGVVDRLVWVDPVSGTVIDPNMGPQSP